MPEPIETATENSDSLGEANQAGLIIDTSFRRRRWYHRRDIRFIAVVVAFVIVFQTYGYLTGSSRITGQLQSVLDGGAEKVDILIWAKFPAEAFHMEIYQKVGSMRGGVGDAVKLARVKAEDVRFLSRKYWIDRIELAPPAKK